MKQKFVFVVLFSLLAVLILPLAVGAAEPTNPLPPPVGSGEVLIQRIDTVINWVFAFMMVLAVLFILIAAFQFVTGGAKGAEEGREKLIWAIVGIIIALLAKSFPAVLKIIVA